MSKIVYKPNILFSTPDFLKMSSFGLDISDESIKYLSLMIGKDGLQVQKYGEKKIPKGIIELGKVKDPIKLEEIISNLKKEVNIKNVRVSILENQIYLFRLKLDKNNLKDINESIEFVLEEHIPIPASETIFDYEIIEEKENEIVLQVAATQIDIVEDYLKIFENCSINVHSFELEAQSIARSIIKNDNKETYMIIDIGEKRTGIFIVSHNIVVFTSTIDFGSVVFNNMLEEHLGISFEEAENIKIKYGLQRNIKEKDIFPIILNGASLLRDEILKHFFYWHSHEDEDGVKNPPIRKIFLCGGTSSMIGLVDYFSISMKINVEIANVWSNIFDIEKKIPNINFKEALSFATAIGLALGDFEHD